MKKVWFVILLLSAISCRTTDCGNEITISKLTSPDGERHAFLFTRNCGATTGINAQVSVLPVFEELPNQGGNIFICDAQPKQVQLEWVGRHLLQIRYPQTAHIFLKLDSLGGTKIRYLPTDEL